MKCLLSIALLSCVVFFNPIHVEAQTNSNSAQPVSPVEKATLEKHTKPILAALHLSDPAKEAQVRGSVASYLKALNAWHAKNDARIKPLWNEFNQSRSRHDEAAADAALAKIDEVYASFKPEHEKFIKNLSSVLSPEQIETVEDVLTVNKVEVTFRAYGQIFHGLTDEQKAFILSHLKEAREQAIDAGTMTEKSAFFKKYKIQIESYLTAQGYDVKQAYKEFVAKLKAQEAAKKSGTRTK